MTNIIRTDNGNIEINKSLMEVINAFGLEYMKACNIYACALHLQAHGAHIIKLEGKHIDWYYPKSKYQIVRRTQFRKGWFRSTEAID